VAAVIINIEQAEDVVGAVTEARADNGESQTPEEETPS